jgi:zinc transporter 1/2/3
MLIAIDKLIVDRAVQSEKHQYHQHHHHIQEEEEEHGRGHAHGEAIYPSHVARVVVGLDNTDEEKQNLLLEEQKEDSSHRETKQGFQSVGKAYLFLVALSIHSLFDGMSLGAQDSNSGFYGLAIAVLSHKLLDGFALGVPVFNAQFSKFQTLFSLGFCALMTPLGILLGWATTWSSSANSDSIRITRGVILSISLGSFLYISLMELIPAALSNQHKIAVKLLLCFIGWTIMSILAIWL